MVVVGEWGFLSHFTGAETEAQRKEVTCPQSQLGSGGSRDPDPGLPGSGVCIKTDGTVGAVVSHMSVLFAQDSVPHPLGLHSLFSFLLFLLSLLPPFFLCLS